MGSQSGNGAAPPGHRGHAVKTHPGPAEGPFFPPRPNHHRVTNPRRFPGVAAPSPAPRTCRAQNGGRGAMRAIGRVSFRLKFFRKIDIYGSNFWEMSRIIINFEPKS
jgi:hypothetical protein